MRSILYFLNGTIASLIYLLNTLLWFMPIMLCSLVKLLPIKPLQRLMSIIADECASLWISVNQINQAVFSRTTFKVTMPATLSIEQWYLVIANHQSWVDILVLQRIFNRKIPFLKFFLKQNLILVPFIGLVWWGLDFPFMKRYSRSFLEKNPHLKGKDLETTQKACEKFENKPVSIMNFLEGTRFSEKKCQTPIHKTLGLHKMLAPKSGGIAYVLSAMGPRLTDLVNVTIFYPQGIPTFGDFVSGKVNEIVVDVETISIASLFETGVYSAEYFNDETQKQQFQHYVNSLWQHKQNKLIQLEQEYKIE
ncbi:acyltransferase [Glaciecola punicea]|jgi:1-acyl-sn-glycerol-3-phosphate acyltransferase|nr:acyltransferase [Glaciecola punicea]OFA30157.1 acyltransferase [Glaciecola punicea]